MRLLVIQTAFPGDAILTLPMIQKLYEKYENPLIDVIAIPSTKIIFGHPKYVNEVIVYDKKDKDKSLLSLFFLIQKIRKQKYNIVVSPHRSSRSSLIAFFSGADETIAFDESSLSSLYKTVRQYNSGDHEVKRNLSLINYDVSGDSWKVLPEFEIPVATEAKINDILVKQQYDSSVVVAPGSVWATKRYPFEQFVEIVKILTAENRNVIIIGGKEDKEAGDKLVEAVPKRVINLAGQLNMIESIALLRKCNLLISNDSAPTHMGVAANIPVLTIYCSTTPRFGFYPYNSLSKSISDEDLYCKPCGIHGYQKCPEGHFKCGYELLPSNIADEAMKILAGDIH